ncbi:dockerin type I repeat-containing protein [bacterium]|nr:dockerin type I repeat-containing protein [candidate division CSSED10-310 bacterium]
MKVWRVMAMFACLALMAVPGAFCQNLLLNPSFESWDSGLPVSWEGETGVTITQETDPVYDGTYSAGLAATSSQNRGIFQIVPVTEGYEYEFSVYLFGPTVAGSIGIYINWLDSGGSAIGGVGTFYTTGFGSYEMVTSGHVQAPTDAVNARCRIRAYADSAFGGYADFASVIEHGQGEPTPTPTDTPPPTATPTGPTPTPPPVSAIKLNEVFINSVGTDAGCFIELYYPGGVSLDNYSIVGVNGNGGVDYQVIDLTGYSIPSDGFFVIAQDDTVANYDMISTNADYQNGPDSIQLRMNEVVVDAMGYGDFSSAIFAGEGSPAPIIDPQYDYSRIPDGVDTDDNLTDFQVGLLTPGGINQAAPIEPTPTPTTPPEPTETPTPGTPTVTPTTGPCPHDGDVNQDGSLTATDAQQCFLIVLGLMTPTPDQECAADCNNDSQITAGDAQNIFLAVLGLATCFDPLI